MNAPVHHKPARLLAQLRRHVAAKGRPPAMADMLASVSGMTLPRAEKLEPGVEVIVAMIAELSRKNRDMAVDLLDAVEALVVELDEKKKADPGSKPENDPNAVKEMARTVVVNMHADADQRVGRVYEPAAREHGTRDRGDLRRQIVDGLLSRSSRRTSRRSVDPTRR